MSDQRFLELYERHRRDDQYTWYRGRIKEFNKANRQAVNLAFLLLLFTSIANSLSGAGFDPSKLGLAKLWAVLAVILPALSAALTAYRGLYAFQEQAKAYRDAAYALQVARSMAPDFARTPRTPPLTRDQVKGYVRQVEEILRLEQGQWGQIAAEIRPIAEHTRESDAAARAGGDSAEGTDPGGGSGDDGGGRPPPPAPAAPGVSGTADASSDESTQLSGDARTETETAESTPSTPVDTSATTVITATTSSAESSLAAEQGGVAVLEAEEEPGLAPPQEPEPSPEEAPATGAEEPADGPPPEEERG